MRNSRIVASVAGALLFTTTAAAMPGDPAPRMERARPLSLAESLVAPEASANPATARVTAEDRPKPESLPLYHSLARKAEIKFGGAIYGDFDTSIGISSDVLVGAKVDFEDTLGIDQSTNIARVDGAYRFNPRHETTLSVYEIRRSGSRFVDEDIPIGEEVFPAGDIRSTFNTTIVKLAYRYNFVTDHRTKVGASFGIHSMGIDAEFRTGSGSVEETLDVIAPLPVLGLHAEYALTRTLHLMASMEVFQIDVGVARGRLADSVIGIEHDLFEHVGWGVAINNFDMDASVDGDGPLAADLTYTYQGILAYIRFYI